MPMLNDTHMVIYGDKYWATGTEVRPGSAITDFRGGDDVFRYISKAPGGNSQGKIVTDRGGELYPSVFGLKIVPRTPAPLAALHAYNAAHADEAITAVENPLATALADVDNAREAYENRGYHDTDAYVDVLERLTEAVRAQLRAGPRT